MCFNWHGSVRAEEVVNLGPLALLGPLLERLDVARIIDRHLPRDVDEPIGRRHDGHLRVDADRRGDPGRVLELGRV